MTAPVISVVLGAVRPLDSGFRICLLICQLKQSSQYVALRKINDDGAYDDVSTGGLYKKTSQFKTVCTDDSGYITQLKQQKLYNVGQ